MIASAPISRQLGTLIGFSAILLWSLLAVFTVASGTMPSFQLLAVTFLIGSLALFAMRPRAIAALRQPPQVWALGVVGLFVYHFAYYFALRHAPPVEAGLINYLWPLLIVLFSAILPGERLRWHHVLGAFLGLAGAMLAVTRGRDFGFAPEHLLGYGAALVAALSWSSYSVLSRRFAAISSDAIPGFCLATAILAALCHLLLEPQTIWPSDTLQWAAIIGLGLGPVGIAFYVWDIGVKHGDIQVLGAAAYSAPLLSTLLLILAGFASYSHTILTACILITLGALLASKDLLLRRRETGGAGAGIVPGSGRTEP